MENSIATHNGTVTIENTNTGNHRTFKINTVKNGDLKGKRIVSLLTGSDNWENYSGFGFVNADGKINVFKKHKNSVHEVYAKMLENPAPFESKGAEYLFSTKCRICNKKLTTPESIKSGIGPICEGR